jgi:hypothetical protein
MASKVVTNFQPGATVPVTVQATVAHPGWYRISLKQGASSTQTATGFPDPATLGAAGSAQQCTPAFMDNPVWSTTQPVLADKLGLPAGSTSTTTSQSGTKTFNVTIPSSASCTTAAPCTLQVVMFMTDHSAGSCNYHHCADITVQATGTGGTGGSGAGGRGGNGGGGRGGNGGSTAGTAGRGGTTGSAGTNGSAGTTGSAGTNGAGGTTGSAGAAGTSGAAGDTGSTGAAGVSGAAGDTGTTGSAGSYGGADSLGRAGTNGSAGATAGATGGPGTAGATGSGSAGTTGQDNVSGGCSMVGEARGGLTIGIGTLTALAAVVARRRRRRKDPPSS